MKDLYRNYRRIKCINS